MGLGDAVAEALARAGITPERVALVARWLGRSSCGGCAERQDKLNALGLWAARVLAGKSRDPARDLAHVTGDDC